MKLTLNGEDREVEGVNSVASLLETLGLSAVPVLVEHNGTALYPREFPDSVLKDGDRLEIIRVVAGG